MWTIELACYVKCDWTTFYNACSRWNMVWSLFDCLFYYTIYVLHTIIWQYTLKLSIAKILVFLRFRKFSNLCAECLLLVRNLKCLNPKLYSYWELKRLIKNNHSTSYIFSYHSILINLEMKYRATKFAYHYLFLIRRHFNT